MLSSARYRHHKSLSDPRVHRAWLSRPLRRLILRAVVLVALSVFLFLMFLRAHKPSKQAVEDFIKCAASSHLLLLLRIYFVPRLMTCFVNFIANVSHLRYTTQDLGWSDPRKSLNLDPLLRARIWAFEIKSGRHPSSGSPPKSIRNQFSAHGWELQNPALPFDQPSHFGVINAGLSRHYISLGPAVDASTGQSFAPRPHRVTLDLDKVMQDCAFENGKYVSDCLLQLSQAAGLSTGLPRQHMLFSTPQKSHYTSSPPYLDTAPIDLLNHLRTLPARDAPETPTLPAFPSLYRHYLSQSPVCEHDRQPRIFHMFWTGPFTDKPYMAALSFLYSQNLGLDVGHEPDDACRPQLWFWLVPGPAVSSLVYPPSAYENMVASLQQNVWAAPLLADRFKGMIQFHLFNATEQLDATPELAAHWRSMSLFKSGLNLAVDTSGNDPMLKLAGSGSQQAYDKLSVVLSDMARFLLTHRFGGVYVDTDTLLLRDFEELFTWSGAFAYRWSRMREFNTAVMKLKCVPSSL